MIILETSKISDKLKKIPNWYFKLKSSKRSLL